MPADLAAARVATRATYERAKCAYSILPTSTIKPVSDSPAPTSVSGMSGLGGCAAVHAGDE